MKFVYFTKTLRSLDLAGHVEFLKKVGLDGADLTVRPGYPVNPQNVAKVLPEAKKRFDDAGLVFGLVSAPTNLVEADSKEAKATFEACGAVGVPAVKIGYFRYSGDFQKNLDSARKALAKFADLAKKTGVRACYHTHSGSYLGCNAASMRLLMDGLDPHHVGVYLDTGHTAVDGGPIGMELDTVRPWLSLIAIKDMLYEKKGTNWRHFVVPVSDGIVDWKGFAKGIAHVTYNGTISLHAEYHTKNLEERADLAKRELAALKKLLG